MADIVKGVATFTTAGEADVDEPVLPFPSYTAVTVSAPAGSAVVANVALPLDIVAVPSAVVEPLL